MRSLQPYHLAWLAAHPHRSASWLRERLGDGFDVHHLDGDHANNEPKNLVLMEQSDHLALHGVPIGKMLRQRSAPDLVEGKRLYEEYLASDKSWAELARECGHSYSWANHKAKAFALFTGSPWPIEDKEILRGKMRKPKPRRNAYYEMMAGRA